MSYETSRRAHPSSGFPIPSSDSAKARPLSWLDRRVLDIRGFPIGIVVAVYTDSATGCPAWLGIDVGGDTIADLVIAPTNGASFDGTAVTVAYDYDQVVATSRTMLKMLTDAIDRAGEPDGDTTHHEPRTRETGDHRARNRCRRRDGWRRLVKFGIR